jgi:hypothetical protein
MKKLYFLLLLLSGITNAQIVNIPDANFKAKLILLGIDTNSDGNIQQSEALSQTYLDVSNSNISDLTGIEAFTNLTYLDCKNNTINTLNLTGLNSMTYLNCSNNIISGTLNLSSLSLTFLVAGNNNITDLLLCPSIQRLFCNNNQLTQLQLFNQLYGYIDVSYNQLGNDFVIPNAYISSGHLDISGNNYTQIDLSNITVSQDAFFVCENTNLLNLDFPVRIPFQQYRINNNAFLQSINFKNGIADYCPSSFLPSPYCGDYLQFNNNPNLSYICADEVEIPYITDETLDIPNIVVNSYCSFIPGGNFNTISGNVKFDSNNDGCNIDDEDYQNIRVNINDGISSGSSFTSVNGDYTFFTQNGNFTVSPIIENQSWFTVTPTSVSVNFPNNDNNTATQDFCITANGIHPDLEIVISPVFPSRPGFDAVYKIVYRNKGNFPLSQQNGVTLAFDLNRMDFLAASVLPSQTNTGSLSWDYTNLRPFESREILVTFNINAPTDAIPVNIGDVLTFTATVLPQVGDEDTGDNVYVYNEIVVGSYDPNDITCLEGDVVSPAEIGNYLHYMIRFENTGTAEAENVVVRTEVNPADFDINSLQLLNTSHPVDARIRGNIVEFIFQNILLESGGHGNVLLKVKSKSSLQQGDSVKKSANIYFDYNYPIATNEAETTFQALNNPSFEQDQSISLYPNPAKDIVNVSGDFQLHSVQLYDVQGRLLQTQLVEGNQTVLDIASQSNGVYFIKVTSDKGIKVGKVVKE